MAVVDATELGSGTDVLDATSVGLLMPASGEVAGIDTDTGPVAGASDVTAEVAVLAGLAVSASLGAVVGEAGAAVVDMAELALEIADVIWLSNSLNELVLVAVVSCCVGGALGALVVSTLVVFANADTCLLI